MRHRKTTRSLFVFAALWGMLFTATFGATNPISWGGVVNVTDAASVGKSETPSIGAIGPNDDADPDDEVNGWLMTRPEDGIGVWTVQCQVALTCVITVTVTTLLDDGVPAPGVWVEAKGIAQPGGLLAERVRIDDYEAQEIVVRLRDGVSPTSFAQRHDLTLKSSLLASANIYLFVTDDDEEEEIDEVRSESDVVWAELNYTQRVPGGDGYKTWRWGGEDGAGYVNQQAFFQVNLAPALEVTQGQGAVVAVLDTGVHLAHPDLAPRLLPGRDVVADDAEAQDEGPGFGWGHGTHVAGVIARMAPQSKILPVRVLDANGRGNVFTLAYAIEWAVQEGADVINLSLGAEGDSQVLADAINNAQTQGVVVVAAAGNDDVNALQYPAGYAGVLGVTAVDDQNSKAAFANYGSHWIDLAAPGVGITSTVPYSGGVGYASWSGTSMSTAFVSGASALVRAARPDATANEIGAQLIEAGANLDAANPGYVRQLGVLLDVGATLTEGAPAPPPSPAPSPEPSPVATPHVSAYLPLITNR
jgi:thermitase